MPTDISDIRPMHRNAVLTSIDVVDAVRPEHLNRPTPCAGWTLADLLTHMTVQHVGFAAAARGSGADENVWEPETVRASVIEDPAGSYAAAAHDVLAAFAADDTPAGSDLDQILAHLGRRPDWAQAYSTVTGA